MDAGFYFVHQVDRSGSSPHWQAVAVAAMADWGKPSGGLRGEDFAGRFDSGSTVDTSSESTQRGRVRTVQYNPREGQCYPVSS